MRTALFLPCYIQELHPEVGLATVEVLRSRGVFFDVPRNIACCGQPLVNAGGARTALGVATRAVSILSNYDTVVCPSASCTAMLRDYQRLGLSQESLPFSTYELCDFLLRFFPEASEKQHFEFRVGVHEGCHGLRELCLGRMSERVFDTKPSVLEATLTSLAGVTLVRPERQDECCGFGGSFSIDEPAISARMGQDKLAAFEAAGAEVVTSSDMSCLMHLQGIARRRKSQIRLLHIAQILSGRVDDLGEGD